MKKAALAISLCGILAGGLATAQSKDKYVIDPAPSGKERSETAADVRGGGTVTHPGKDAPVTESRQGNRIKLDYDTKGQPGKEDDTTYIIRTPQGSKSTGQK
ncbi:hypothetical protein ACPWT1_07965 [Ramlibacter sp. MMS24-I3-19]|uniref:hypothetical protein n=1 Tax=Ramlibacter sp. MMS24-I3-19 TaxID=3416606 RepID=UPI003D0756CA